MAIYHLHVDFVQRSGGRSAVAAAAYRSGERLQDERRGEVYDFRHKKDVVHKEIMLPDGAPEGFTDRETFWNKVEAASKRKDAQPAFEIEVALPRELTPQQRVKLAQSFAREHLVAKGLAVDLCIHNVQASDGGEHPHCHMLVATRRFEPNGSFGKIARDMQDNPKLVQKVYALLEAGQIDDSLILSKGTNLAAWRSGWADRCNDFLAEYGHDVRIDHRTLEAQKIDREAKPYIGFAIHNEIENLRGWLADRVESLKAIKWRDAIRSQFKRVQRSRGDLTAEFIAHAREYARDLVPETGPEPGKDRERGYDR